MWYHHQCSKMMIPFKMSGFHADEQAQGHGVRTTRGEKRRQREIDEQPVFRLFCVCHETGLENILLPSCTLWEKKTCETAAEVLTQDVESFHWPETAGGRRYHVSIWYWWDLFWNAASSYKQFSLHYGHSKKLQRRTTVWLTFGNYLTVKYVHILT